jgi:hypothetical protein
MKSIQVVRPKRAVPVKSGPDLADTLAVLIERSRFRGSRGAATYLSPPEGDELPVSDQRAPAEPDERVVKESRLQREVNLIAPAALG